MRARRESWRWTAVILTVALAGCGTGVEEADAPAAEGDAAAGGEDAAASAPAAPAAPSVQTFVIPAGTTLTFSLGETLNTGTTVSGDTFSATLGEPIVRDGTTLIPAGASATGRVAGAEQSGRVQGRASIQLVMSEISTSGQTLALSTRPFEATAASSTTDDAVTIGAGAGIGAAIGAALGGGEGAAIGAAIGGGGGTAVVLATRGEEIELPSGTLINFQLSEALELTR